MHISNSELATSRFLRAWDRGAAEWEGSVLSKIGKLGKQLRMFFGGGFIAYGGICLWKQIDRAVVEPKGLIDGAATGVDVVNALAACVIAVVGFALLPNEPTTRLPIFPQDETDLELGLSEREKELVRITFRNIANTKQGREGQ